MTMTVTVLLLMLAALFLAALFVDLCNITRHRRVDVSREIGPIPSPVNIRHEAMSLVRDARAALAEEIDALRDEPRLAMESLGLIGAVSGIILVGTLRGSAAVGLCVLRCISRIRPLLALQRSEHRVVNGVLTVCSEFAMLAAALKDLLLVAGVVDTLAGPSSFGRWLGAAVTHAAIAPPIQPFGPIGEPLAWTVVAFGNALLLARYWRGILTTIVTCVLIADVAVAVAGVAALASAAFDDPVGSMLGLSGPPAPTLAMLGAGCGLWSALVFVRLQRALEWLSPGSP